MKYRVLRRKGKCRKDEINKNYLNTLCHFPPKSDDFTDFCEGKNENGQQKKYWKFILKILLKLYSKIHNF